MLVSRRNCGDEHSVLHGDADFVSCSVWLRRTVRRWASLSSSKIHGAFHADWKDCDHSDHSDHADHSDHSDHADHSDHSDHGDHSEHSDHSDHSDQGAGVTAWQGATVVNYLAHSLPFVFDDDPLTPWRVAGTSLPDWLRVIDKQARLRPEVLAHAPTHDPRYLAMSVGARRHHDDDLRFHADANFDALSRAVAADIRLRFPGQRASALGHVLVEMLLDAVLLQQHPQLLIRFYQHVDALDDAVVAAYARETTKRPIALAEMFLRRFRSSRFLALYATDEGLCDCLRGVWRRAGIGDLPPDFVDVVSAARASIAPLAASVLPAPHGRN